MLFKTKNVVSFTSFFSVTILLRLKNAPD